jgi:hypothetical protein
MTSGGNRNPANADTGGDHERQLEDPSIKLASIT